MTWYTREINSNLFVMSFDRRFTQRRLQPGRRAERQRDRVVPARRARQRRDRQQLLPDAALELQRALGPGRLATDRPPDAEPRLAVGLQHAGVRGGESAELRVRHDQHQPRDVAHQHRAVAGRGPRARRPRVRRRSNGNPKYPYQCDKNNIQPRVGFAYQLNDKTIVRGGYGLYYLNVVEHRIARTASASRRRSITSLDGDRTSTFPLRQSVLAGHPGGAGLVARAGDVPRPRPSLLERRLREPVRAPVLARHSSGSCRGGRRSSSPTSAAARATSRTGGAASTSRRVALRDRCDPTKGGSAAFCNELLPNPFFQRRRVRGDRRGSPARRCRATS